MPLDVSLFIKSYYVKVKGLSKQKYIALYCVPTLPILGHI